MDAEELRAKIDEAKAREQEEERIQASRAEARARAIAEHTAAGKDAFAHGDYREAERQCVCTRERAHLRSLNTAGNNLARDETTTLDSRYCS